MNDHEHEPGSSPESGEREPPPQLAPRIWIASLADYNDGILHGDWVDAWGDRADLEERIGAILATSPTPGAEEWAIFDHDSFAGVRIEEYEDLDVVLHIANGVREHGPAFGAWADLCDKQADALDEFAVAYLGHWPNLAAYAEHLLDELGYTQSLAEVLPAWLLDHVTLDADRMARDLDASGHIATVSAPGGSIWIFDNNLR